MGHNEDICRIFEQLYTLRLSEAEQQRAQGNTKEATSTEWRAKAYAKVIPILRNYPKRIESGAEARQIQGIGERMAKRIDEILQTGTLEELGSGNRSDQEEVLRLFESVHRVGRKTAEKWYLAGYRHLKDVPRSVCTDAQWTALQLHAHLSQKIPRDEINEFECSLRKFLSPKGIFFQICGSYRRGRKVSSDIDILVIAQEGRDVLTEVLQFPVFTHLLARGPKKFLGIGLIREIYRRIDVEVVQPHEYPFAVTYFTGPAAFNVWMRDYCSRWGLRLNEKSLTDSKGNSYFAESEEHLFYLLGLRYLTPEERDKFN